MANQSLNHSLRFVQVEADTAYIDSRVYCRQVIQVDHADWMRDTLRKCQEPQPKGMRLEREINPSHSDQTT